MCEGKTILSLCIKTRSSWTMALKRATVSWCLGKTFEIVGRIWSCPHNFLFKRFSWFIASEVVGITQIVEQLHLQIMSAFPGPISPAVRTEMKMLPTRHYSGLLDGGTKQFAVWILGLLIISCVWRNWLIQMCLSTSMTKLFYFIPFELSVSSSLPRINIKVLVDHDKQSLNSVSDKHSLNYSWRLKLSNFYIWAICWVMKICKCSLLPPDLQNTINTTLSRHLDNGCFGFFFLFFCAFHMKSISLKTQRCLWLFIYICWLYVQCHWNLSAIIYVSIMSFWTMAIPEWNVRGNTFRPLTCHI